MSLVSHIIQTDLFPPGYILFLLQLSFQMWTGQMQETLNSKKKGDVAFRHKDFRAAIECYTQVRLL